MNILLTGGGGNLGQKLILKINLEGKILKILSRNDNKKLNRIDSRIHYVRGDLLDENSLVEATRNIDLVIHMAGITHTNLTSKYYEINVRGTENIVKACKKNNVKNIIHISSRTASLEGGDYAISKLFSEEIIKKSSLNWTILKLSEVYGKGCRGGINQSILFVKKSYFVPVVGSGLYRMSPVYIDDAIDSILSAVELNIYGRIYIIAGPEELTYNEIINSISVHLNKKVFILHIPIFLLRLFIWFIGIFKSKIMVKDQIPRLLCIKPSDISLARKELNYRPRFFNEGLSFLLSKNDNI